MPFISKTDLELVKEMIFQCEEDCREWCGNLLTHKEINSLPEQTKLNILKKSPDPLSLILYIQTHGEKSSCMNKSYTTYKWHLHSKASKAYPSVEDILSPLRNYPIDILFTMWGIWIIKSQQKYSINKPSEQYEHLKTKYIEPILTKIYENTFGGRSRLLEGKQLEIVLTEIKKLENMLKTKFQTFSISFTPWQAILGDFFVI